MIMKFGFDLSSATTDEIPHRIKNNSVKVLKVSFADVSMGLLWVVGMDFSFVNIIDYNVFYDQESFLTKDPCDLSLKKWVFWLLLSGVN